MTNCIEVHEVVKYYDSFAALSGVSLTVQESSVYGLLGPNGAGKSTLIRILNRIKSADSGKIRLFGEELSQVSLSKIGYMPEERGLYKKMSVADQLLYFGQLKGLKRNDARQRIDRWLDRLDIKDWKNRRIEEFSKGMQQKIQFVATVLHEPRLLIFDEPFSGLDPVNSAILKEEILRLKSEGATALLSTHNMTSVESLCDEISLIDRAQVVLQGGVAEIRQRFRDNRCVIRYRNNSAKLLLPAGVSITEEVREGDLTRMTIQRSASISSSELLTSCFRQVEMVGFEELIPTFEEIFISMVENKNKENQSSKDFEQKISPPFTSP